MPGSTPNFNIRYPCAGETIDADVFATFSQDIEAALAEVSADTVALSTRPRAAIATADTGFACPVGAVTTLNFTTTLFSNNPVELSFGATGITVTSRPALYMASAEFAPLNAVTSVTSWAAAIIGGTGEYGRTLAKSVATTTASRMNVSGIVILVPGGGTDTLSATWEWTGSGGPMNVYCQMSLALICDF